MNTVVCIYLGRSGGASVYSYEMTKGLVENGCRVIAFVSKSVDNLEKWKALQLDALEMIDTYSGKTDFVKNTLRFITKVYPELKKKYHGVTVDACYIPMDHFYSGYICSIFTNAKVIKTVHDPVFHSTNRRIYWWLVKTVSQALHYGKYGRVDDYVILTRKFTEYMVKHYGIAYDHVHVIPHGIFDYYLKNSSDEYYDYDPHKTNYLFFGRIEKYKGVDLLVDAFLEIHKQNPNTTLTIVGSGNCDVFKKKVEGEASITLINRWIDEKEVASYFPENRNVYLVLPYRDATQSGVIPIAMSCGVVVIASDTGGLSEQVENQRNGYLFKANDIKELESCMMDVPLKDNSSIICNAKRYIQSLNWHELSKEIIKIVNE